MKNYMFAVILGCAVVPAVAGFAAAESSVIVGGAPMLPSRDIVDNAVNSADHTTLVAAVKAAGLVDTLKGPGPFTVFAPTNEAFEMLPAGTVETLVKPENKADADENPDLPRGRRAMTRASSARDRGRQRHGDTGHGERRQAVGDDAGHPYIIKDEKGDIAE